MKDTLNFYKKIYDPLFKKKYTKGTHRGGASLDVYEKLLKKDEISNVIDVGCAWGKTLKYWRNNGVPAVGVDVSKISIDYCKKKRFSCYLASATNLSIFEDKQFDLYMASDMYEHLRTDDLSHAIEEAKRITKKYFLIRPHPVLDKRGTLHLTVWSLQQWTDFFKSNGLNIIKTGDDDELIYKNVFLMTIDE